MGLPIQKAPSYNCMLPVSKKLVKYRPFLVKEQSFLLQAKEGDSTKEVFSAIKDLVTAVTDGTVDATKIPLADLEYLFLQIRTKSIGETTTLNLVCNASEECSGRTDIEINLSEIEVDVESIQDDKIKINDTLMVELIPPTTEVIVKVEGLPEAETIKPIMRACLVRIYDEDNIFELSDYRDSEIDDFVESLTVEQFELISEYFQSVPALKHKVEWKCNLCGEQSILELQGLANFF